MASVFYVFTAQNAVSVLLPKKFKNNSDCFVLASLISGYCPTFCDILSLMRKPLYKHPAYLSL